MTRSSPRSYALAALWFAVLLVLGGSGCAPTTERTDGTAPMRPPAGKAIPGFAPTPFTAEQIREAMPVGTRIQIQVTEPTRTSQQWMEVMAATPEGAQIKSWETGGEPESTSAWSEWTQLRDHARFPADATTVEDYRLTTELGTFETWRYTIESNLNGLVNRQVFYFAKDLPGPPISFHQKLGGKQLFEAIMITRSGAEPPR